MPSLHVLHILSIHDLSGDVAKNNRPVASKLGTKLLLETTGRLFFASSALHCSPRALCAEARPSSLNST